MEMIEQHMAASIGVEMIATFLPDEVVEGLYSAVEEAGLHVVSLTLEPIAAINVAIPERFRLLNIALVDVGAGTSDISIVKDGSIIAFGMMPLAGDEITEAIAKKYLVDFETAEKAKKTATKRKTVTMKNILGETLKLGSDDILETAGEAVCAIVDKVAEKIIELNGGNSVSAVFVVGGGGKIPGFTERMAQKLCLPENRVAIRGAEVLQHIDFSAAGVRKDSTLVTPIGICLEYYEQKSNFIHVRVNEERVKLYDNGKATILDACIHAGFSQSSLFPSRGEGFTYTVNGEKREAKGQLGEPAEVRLNGRETNLNETVGDDDEIFVKPATRGEDARMMLGRIPEYREELQYRLFGKTVLCPKRAEVNGKLQSADFLIQEGDRIVVHDFYSVAQLFEFMGMEQEEMVLVNGVEADRRTKLRQKAVVERIEPEEEPEEEQNEQPSANVSSGRSVVEGLGSYAPPSGEDPLLAPVRPLPSWAADLPISNPAAHPVPNMTFMAPPSSGYGQPGAAAAYTVPAAAPQTVQTSQAALQRSISVEVNGKKVSLLPKEQHMFVDVFDVYPFDLTKAGGKRMVSRVNGMEVADFTTPLHENDNIDLYWEK